MRRAIIGLGLLAAACGGGSGGDVVCGVPGELTNVAFETDLETLAGCTTLAGSLRVGDTQLEALDGLESLRRIDGTLNLFRNPRLVDLGGLANLVEVTGELLVHHNGVLASGQLESVRACGELLVSSNASMMELGLGALERVTGDLSIIGNRALPQAQAEAFAAGLDVGGEVQVFENMPAE